MFANARKDRKDLKDPITRKIITKDNVYEYQKNQVIEALLTSAKGILEIKKTYEQQNQQQNQHQNQQVISAQRLVPQN